MVYATFVVVLLTCISSAVASIEGLWCYRCVSTQPGCGHQLDSELYRSFTCPDENDKCVKVIERKGADELITRDCLSSLRAVRRDIPADTYEGCRPAATDVQLGQYNTHSIKENDIRRNHYDSVEWCFCHFDQWCNSGPSLNSCALLVTTLSCLLLLLWR